MLQDVTPKTGSKAQARGLRAVYVIFWAPRQVRQLDNIASAISGARIPGLQHRPKIALLLNPGVHQTARQIRARRLPNLEYIGQGQGQLRRAFSARCLTAETAAFSGEVCFPALLDLSFAAR